MSQELLPNNQHC